MTELDAKVFVDDVLSGLWSNWKPTPAEIEVWVKQLSDISYNDAKDRAEYCHSGPGGKRRKPNVRDLMQSRGGGGKQVWATVTDVYVVCISSPNPKLVNVKVGCFCPVSYDLEQRKKAAEGLRNKIQFWRGGEWIVQTEGEKPSREPGMEG